MTPDEARALLDGTTPGPWLSDLDRNSDEPRGIYAVVAQGDGLTTRLIAEEIVEEADTALIAAAPTLATMAAGMRPEYRAEEWQGPYPGWVPTSPWTAEKPAAGTDPNARIVRRYVTEPEEIK
ncbi:hypothetical protein [Corynebacterium freneyi]|uniref:Uncharacterized protein n=1 Tax=Corynebacterium freneyi TaxID=134034 RepID=A0ABS4U9T4_9CORY|nr:hypothetical protein [Corynebacterium freneyi]MBP2333311.1 hypothetical protein [Corynebacterium freneyi]QXA52637.1 hypothetical protein I6L56_11425 [Corynebacterium freneyi]WJZ04585.1 hypothetical protein CFREN_02995 [Corynebacterium freneyi]